jgi:cardiolipin synthase
VLLAAARRGVRVDLLVDGYGTCDLSSDFISALTEAGARLRVYDPARRVMGTRFNVLRRMHRKIVVVDAQLAFVGGINFSHDHMRDFGPEGKQDYAVRVRGPIVAHIHRFVRTVADQPNPRHWWSQPRRSPPVSAEPVGTADMIFVTRDNHRHRNAIERHYRAAIRSARERVVLANAYFFPGYLLVRQLRRAARRGVQVALILQGEPDMPIVKTAASLLYGYLQSAGVQIYEYRERPLHGKVAVVDGHWSTVGSSNLDPLSLTLNLEANLVIRDADFAAHLGERLEYLINEHCTLVPPEPPAPVWAFWRPLRSFLLFHLLSGYSRWFSWLPHRVPEIHHAGLPSGTEPTTPEGATRHGAH